MGHASPRQTEARRHRERGRDGVRTGRIAWVLSVCTLQGFKPTVRPTACPLQTRRQAPDDKSAPGTPAAYRLGWPTVGQGQRWVWPANIVIPTVPGPQPLSVGRCMYAGASRPTGTLEPPSLHRPSCLAAHHWHSQCSTAMAPHRLPVLVVRHGSLSVTTSSFALHWHRAATLVHSPLAG